MRDFRDAKTTAQTLRAALAAMGFKITVSQSLELIAQAFGVADWNTLSAAIRAQATAVPENTSRPPPTAESAKTPGSPPISLPANPLSGELESTLKQAFAHAMGRKHEEVTVEHLLLFLLDDTDASRVMKASGVNLEDLRKNLTDYIDNDLKSPGDRRRRQPQADPWISARAAARGIPCSPSGPLSGQEPERACGDLLREREPCRQLVQRTGRDPHGRHELHDSRHR